MRRDIFYTDFSGSRLRRFSFRLVVLIIYLTNNKYRGKIMTLQTKSARKVTVTLPVELVVYADSQAERSGTSRSQVISRALAFLMATEEEQLAAEGYAFYSAEGEEFAASAATATAEAWPAEAEREDQP